MNALEIPDHDAWSAWHPLELTRRLSGISAPWCIVGGWALDLWHGQQTRDHDDLEFTVLREDSGIFREALPRARFLYSGKWRRDAFAARHGAAGRYRANLVPGQRRTPLAGGYDDREPGTRQTWVCKRDPNILGPRHEFVRTTLEGIPYLAPAPILLFKAKYQRAKDEADFENALPKLDISERGWLKASLAVVHPGHDWIGVL